MYKVLCKYSFIGLFSGIYFLSVSSATTLENTDSSNNVAKAGAGAKVEAIVEVIVEATHISLPINKAPLAISKIERKQIVRAHTQLGLDESIASIPGIVLQNRFNFAQDLRISIRGFGARANFGIRGVKILVDGIPETLADGQGSVDSIDLTSIGSIEVLRGPSSSLYGNASGGVIRIESDFDNPINGIEARLASGGNGYKKHQIHFNGNNEQLSYIASISHLDIDGYRQHSEHKNTLFNTRMRYTFKDNATLKLVLNHTDQPLANDPGGVNLTTLINDRTAARDRNIRLNAGEELEQTRIGFHYQRDIGSNGEFSIRNYHSWRNFEGRIPIANNGVIDLNRYYTGGGLMYLHRNTIAGLSSNSIIGIDYDYQNDDRNRFENINGLAGKQVLNQREKVTNSALYLQNQIHLNERWLVSSGLRYDEISFRVIDYRHGNSGIRSLHQLSPMLGSSFAITGQATIYANLSSAFESPTTTELALADSTGLNTKLNPQSATNYELGVKGRVNSHSQRYQYSLALFNIDVEQEIIALEDNLGRDIFVNAGESSRHGIELSLASQMNVTQLQGTIDTSVAYTYSDFSYKTFTDKNGNNFSGKALPGLPRNTLHLALNYQSHQRNGLFANLDILYLDQFALNNANTEYMESSLLTDLRAGLRFAKRDTSIEPFIGISNLFNEVYSANARINAFGGRFYESGPKRNLYAGLSIRHNFTPQ